MKFILLDLYPGSLSEGLLIGLPLKDIRPRCHVLSRCYLLHIMNIVNKYTQGSFHNISLKDKEAVHSARVLIKSKGLHHFWIKGLSHSHYWLNRRITAYSFVSPFNTRDITHKYFVHPLKEYIRN